VDIRPQGSAEITFGIVSNRRDDPMLNTRQRRQTNFDFNEKIQMNVIAKIGDKIEFKCNYNTEATFEFENKLKLKYEGKEDDIIQLIEGGDVNLPLNSTLIRGNESLFGIKDQAAFRKGYRYRPLFTTEKRNQEHHRSGKCANYEVLHPCR